MDHICGQCSKNRECRTQNVWAHHEIAHIWLECQRQVCWAKKLHTKGINMLYHFNISQSERVSIIKKWLCRQGLQPLETLIQTQWEACNEKGLFEILNETFKQQYNEAIKLLQFHNIARQHKVWKNGWVGLDTAVECNYKTVDRQFKAQFIYELNDSKMLTEIIREPTKNDENTVIPSECVLAWEKNWSSKSTGCSN